MPTFALITLVNDRGLFEASRASLRDHVDELPDWRAIEPNPKGWNASQGLNHGLEEVDADWVVCLHQDVLFPAGFWQRFTAAVAGLPDDVALAGLVGCEAGGSFRGHIVDPNGHCFWGPLPRDVLTLDEVLVAVRTKFGLRFDEDVPGFHCYGADLCLRAHDRGLRAVAVDAPIVHLSTGRLGEDYERASRWLLARWGARYGHLLPTPTLVLEGGGRARLLRRLLVRWRRRRDVLRRNRNPCGAGRCAALQLAVDRPGVRA